MLTKDHLAASGAALFRWRSFVLTAFLPLMAIAIWQGEAIELAYGQFAGRSVEIIALGLVALGIAIRILTVGYVPARTSGRNTKGQVAETLNTTGLYATVRNPLYLGNAISYLGAVLYTQSLGLTVLMALVLVIYFERIIVAEETFLTQTFGEPYTEWASRTPAFFPKLTQWTRPALPFSWRSTIGREHPTWLGTIFLLYLIEMATTLIEGESLAYRPVWHACLAAALIGQVVIMQIKKRTSFFVVPGR